MPDLNELFNVPMIPCPYCARELERGEYEDGQGEVEVWNCENCGEMPRDYDPIKQIWTNE